MSTDSPAQTLAEAAGKTMFSRDRASGWLGMKFVEIRPGFAKLTMQVREEMVNGIGSCHGGMIFSLADTAFAMACNSYNVCTVAAGCSIEFLLPAFPGDTLMAEASERAVRNRSGVYDVTVTNQDGDCVALFRGKSHRIQGEVIGPEKP